MKKNKDAEYMKLALKLAARGEGKTSPNPAVGAVVVRNGEIIGRGYHKKAGRPHAEIEAFRDAEKHRKDLKGATLYVTLEPCCHEGKRTPPCVNAIIDKGITDVYVAAPDPNPKVSGKGIARLKRAGVNVTTGLLEKEAKELNRPFFKFISTGTPYVTLKLAATLDGKIASYTGDSKWIGSDRQRTHAHRLRDKSDAVMVGMGTVLTDNPRLNVRLKGRNIRQPVPVVLDTRLRISPDSALFSVHERVIIATAASPGKTRRKKLEDEGAEILTIGKNRRGSVDLKALMNRLADRGIMSLLIEGGSSVASQALESGIVDKITFFYAPRILGGDALSMVGKLGIKTVSGSIGLSDISIKKTGDEFLVEGLVRYNQEK